MFSITRNAVSYAKKHYDAIPGSSIDTTVDHMATCFVMLLAIPFTVCYDIGTALGEECMRKTPEEIVQEKKALALLQPSLRRSARLAEKARSTY